MAPFSFFKDLEEEHRRKSRQPASWWNLLFLCPVLLVLTWYIYSFNSRSQVAKRQLIAVGSIDTHDPSNHDRYGYIFSVDGKTFRGWAYPGTRRDFHVGETVAVYFDPRDPTTNSPSDFHEVDPGSGLILGWCLLCMAGLPWFIFLQRRAAKKAGG